MKILNEIKTNEMLVKIDNVKNPFYCKIIESQNEKFPFHYDAKYISELEEVRCQTYEEAFTNLTKHLGNLVEPPQINESY